jgi:hypothetical protein
MLKSNILNKANSNSQTPDFTQQQKEHFVGAEVPGLKQ